MDTSPAVHPYRPRPHSSYSHARSHSLSNKQHQRLPLVPRSQSYSNNNHKSYSNNHKDNTAFGSLLLFSSSAPSTPTQTEGPSTLVVISTDNNIPATSFSSSSSYSSCTTPSSSSAAAGNSGPYPHPLPPLCHHPLPQLHLNPAFQTTSAQPPSQQQQLSQDLLTTVNSHKQPQPLASCPFPSSQQQHPSNPIKSLATPILSLLSSSSSPSTLPSSLLSETDRQTRDPQESSKHIISSMPPATHIRQGSTGLGTSQWEPYPPTTSSRGADRETSLHKSCYSFSSPFSPSAPTQPPSSMATDLTATELDLQEFSIETVSQLLKQTLSSFGNKNAVLLLDMRSAVSHAELNIKTSVGISLPNMLLKRPMYSLGMVTKHLTTGQEAETFSNWRQFSNIVLFDAAGATPVRGTPLFCFAQKFGKEGCSARIGYIQGGFNAFAQDHADLCSSDNSALSQRDNSGTPLPINNHSRAPSSDSSPRSNSPASSSGSSSSNTSPPQSHLHLGSLPSMITRPIMGDTVAQTPMFEGPNVNPLFESVCQSMGLNTDITEEIPVRLPSGFSVDMIREHLPNWLLNAVDERVGKSRLAKYFQKVEIIEKKRLALLLCPQAMRSGKASDYSIGSSVEKGLKNRYNNVWPFDHTRIKINELDQNGDDYINASLLIPPFGRRSYIATQAPLPSTFLDFWKVIWEQNTRIVVMLTREVEMGRVKCHKYWPTAQEPVLDLGTVQVTFVSEYQPQGVSASVLVRQMKLRHTYSTQEPERTITQLQYTGWPDFGVPEMPLEVLQLIELADAHSIPASAGPMMVHCSAGCGRTGAFCVIDSVLSELKYRPESILCDQHPSSGNASRQQQQSSTSRTDFRASLPSQRVLEAMSNGRQCHDQAAIDEAMEDVVFATVTKFREQRLSMVQCLRQYVFCYEAILWYLGMVLTKDRSDRHQVPQTPAIALSPSRKGNAPNTTTNEDCSYFG